MSEKLAASFYSWGAIRSHLALHERGKVAARKLAATWPMSYRQALFGLMPVRESGLSPASRLAIGILGVALSAAPPAIAGITCTGIEGFARVGSGPWTSQGILPGTTTCERTFESRGAGRGGDGRGLNEGGRGRRGGDELSGNLGGTNEETGQKTAVTCPVVANPVVLATGNKVEPESDFGTAGEMALHSNRTWNQFWDGIGLFGWNWLSNFDYRLSFDTSSPFSTCYARPSVAECADTSSATNIWAHRPDGRKIRFTKNAADGVYYEDKASPISKVVRQADGTLLLTFEDNLVEQYSKGGYPLYVQDEHGLRWTFAYGGMNNTQVQKVTHTNGRYVQFVWVGDELREVKDPAGSSYSFTYTAKKYNSDMTVIPGIHLLKTSARPGTPATTITYHYAGEAGEPSAARHALTGKSFNGVRYSWFTYDSAVRTASSEHADGVERYTFVYTPGANNAMTVLETNPLGKQATYDFLDAKLVGVTGHASANCSVTGSGNTYDANGYLDTATDNNGNVTDYDYSSAGRLTKKVEGYGSSAARTTTYAWDTATNRISSETVAGHARISYTYAADRRLASVAAVNLSANGVANQTLTTTYSYTKHPSGLLASVAVDGPLPGTGDAVVSNYDAYGNLISVQNSLGHNTGYSSYNALGLPGRVTGANGDITDFVYDARGRITSEKRWINGAWQTTAYTYDGAGRLASVQRPDGQVRNFEYDAAWRLVREYEAEADGVYAQKRYTYNKLSLVTRIDTERTTVPTAPPVLSAPGSSADGSYTVSWAAIADATSYRLEESANGGAWVEIQNAAAIGRAFSGKVNGSYGYRARACNAMGCGAYSAMAMVTVSLAGPPASPSMTAPPSYSGGSYNASWSGAAGATSYRLEESRNGGAWSEIYNGAGTSLGFNKGGSADFSYRVRACNTHGCSAYSATRTVTVEVEQCPSCLMAPQGGEPTGALDAGEDGV